jgi:thioredoxin reductase
MYEIVIVGGGTAGLQTALILGRARRRVLVLDSGRPRNAPAAHAHGFLTRDGTPPGEILRIGREELQAYPSVELRSAVAVDARGADEGFSLSLADGETVEARKLVLASGVRDTLPDIPGMSELWGNGVYHCPFCHGWEVRDKPWAIWDDTSFVFERVALYRGWTGELVVLADGPSSLNEVERARIEALGAAVDQRAVERIERSGKDDVQIVFVNGSSRVFGGLFVAPELSHSSSLAEALGCELVEMGPARARFIKTDPVSGETTVPGVYAAGDIISPSHSLILVAASGAQVGYRLAHSMAIQEAEAVSAEGSVDSQA